MDVTESKPGVNNYLKYCSFSPLVSTLGLNFKTSAVQSLSIKCSFS